MNNNDLIINQGSSFLISDRKGDIEEKDYYGLFFHDMRHLSRFAVRLVGNELMPLTSEEVNFNTATIVVTNQKSHHLEEESLSIIRRRKIDGGYHEDISVMNHLSTPLNIVLQILFDTDFLDIFDLKNFVFKNQNILPKKLHVQQLYDTKKRHIIFRYKIGTFLRETLISLNIPFTVKNHQIFLSKKIASKKQWKFCIRISFVANNKYVHAPSCNSHIQPNIKNFNIKLLRALDTWEWSTPQLETDWEDLRHAYTKSIFDLASLRVHGSTIEGVHTELLAAGLPWFMAVFGRDSLITAYQTIILGNSLAKSTLEELASLQGKKNDPLSEEQPGKILHEMRYGQTAYSGSWVKFPYYGASDTTPLFLILLSEAYRFGGNTALVKKMKPHVLAALEWIKNADMDKDGFVEYKKMSSHGLDNQNWRDSKGSMVFQNGDVAQAPIASADIQGYVYDAKLRMAEIADELWNDHVLAEKLRQEAHILKERFNKSFWITDKEYFAMGLDRDKNQIDSLASSNGQLLWSGIVDTKKIHKVVQKLLSPELFSGWGVRTISKNDKGFSPLVYHKGTVWPHDNSLIASGLMKAGCRKEALSIIQAIMSASYFFHYRLPEVFAGYDRDIAVFPIEFPTASSPQAWAAGTTILFLRLILGIEPDESNKTLRIDPIFPEGVRYIRLRGVSAFGKYFSIEATPKKSSLQEIEPPANYT